MSWKHIVAVSFLVAGCSNSDDAERVTNPAAANKFIEETKEKVELSERVGELRNGYQSLRASCEGSEQGCGAVDALRPQLEACTRMNAEACDALESAMNELK